MPLESRGFVWEVLLQELIVVSYSDSADTAEQWRDYLSLLAGFEATEEVRFLAYSETAPERRTIESIIRVARGKPWRVALLSPSIAVRFAASTFSFAVRGLKFFAPEELAAALQHLGCDAAQSVAIRLALARVSGRPERFGILR